MVCAVEGVNQIFLRALRPLNLEARLLQSKPLQEDEMLTNPSVLVS
jgi:hypothetical protein